MHDTHFQSRLAIAQEAFGAAANVTRAYAAFCAAMSHALLFAVYARFSAPGDTLQSDAFHSTTFYQDCTQTRD